MSRVNSLFLTFCCKEFSLFFLKNCKELQTQQFLFLFVNSQDPTQAPNVHMAPPEIRNYKKQLCINWPTPEGCPYGECCRFAHGEAELRKHPRYRTTQCKYVYSSSGCSLGDCCHFLHDEAGHQQSTLCLYLCVQTLDPRQSSQARKCSVVYRLWVPELKELFQILLCFYQFRT